MSVVFNIAYTAAAPSSKATEFQRSEWNKERVFYNLTAPYNFVTYSLNGKKTAKNKDALDYFQKDTGAFNLDRDLSEEDIAKLKENLAKTSSIIWHGFVSFDKETSAAFTTPKQAREYLKRTMSALFEKSHLDMKNIEMMASLHVDKAHHHHIHFSFWEKEAKKRDKNGEMQFTKKGCFSQKSIDNYVIAAGLQLEDNKNDLHIARDKAIARLKDMMAPTNKATRKKDISAKLVEIAQVLPTTGRLGYNSDNMANLRSKVDAAVDYIVARDDVLKTLVADTYHEIALREKKAQEIAKSGRILWTQGGRLTPSEMEDDKAAKMFEKYGVASNRFACIDKLRPDFKSRMGQIIINAAKRVKNERARNVAMSAGAGKNALRIAARRNATLMARDFNRFISGIVQSTEMVKVDFTADLRRAEREIEQGKYDKIGG